MAEGGGGESTWRSKLRRCERRVLLPARDKAGNNIVLERL